MSLKIIKRLDDKIINDDDSELVIGLVGAVGTDMDNIKKAITERLAAFRYTTEEIRISSDIISLFRAPPKTEDNFEKISTLMTEGNNLRRISEDNAILARAAAAKINQKRNKSHNGKDNISIPSPRKAYIISSLKHPEEVKMLRDIYTNGFYLIGVYADEKRRTNYLIKNKFIDSEKAKELISRDSEEKNEWGQHTRDTYELSDFFINYTGSIDKINNDLWRILDLMFGNPYITPTFDEYSMFMAFSASLRSADLSRQVGAVLTKNRNIISTGANDVPKFGGGLYWSEYINGEIQDHEKGRDYKLGEDSNVKERKIIIEDILSHLPIEEREPIKSILEKSKLKYITEYGRVVHAEMEAILACARSNISTHDGVLYCTTFPCHNCAKHIIASGINRVVYIEPYPKSKAFDFHPDAISTPDKSTVREHVIFEPFVGVGPRCFFNLFSINLGIGYKIKRKDKDGNTLNWSRKNSKLRMQMLPSSYIERESVSADVVARLAEILQNGQ
ncbi:anti-phage dCTP deaminase [Pectobacterium carotovorum subsp. carotovorum]|uniref:anti-phage dCTP deaminase n=1 Tax=Pectobacterium carotovorum TaxID=554 RepID=UPI0023662C45|nr:anti-phage dCTP deaminase [Pectobacterium carotovorum]WDF98834.1 anti-phage dCTP deaminase [Pectobacterium carotovorum subsp. carotovorum]